jgi:hypothetical protein
MVDHAFTPSHMRVGLWLEACLRQKRDPIWKKKLKQKGLGGMAHCGRMFA